MSARNVRGWTGRPDALDLDYEAAVALAIGSFARPELGVGSIPPIGA